MRRDNLKDWSPLAASGSPNVRAMWSGQEVKFTGIELIVYNSCEALFTPIMTKPRCGNAKGLRKNRVSSQETDAFACNTYPPLVPEAPGQS